jgi:hypothetical protein
MRTWEAVLLEDLAASAEDAAALLRLTLAEDKDHPETVLSVVQRIARARGGIDDLGLNLDEKAELASVLGRSLAITSLPKAA